MQILPKNEIYIYKKKITYHFFQRFFNDRIYYIILKLIIFKLRSSRVLSFKIKLFDSLLHTVANYDIYIFVTGLKKKKKLNQPQPAENWTGLVDRIDLSRTAMGRARAWLRMALMQKKLADYLKVLIDHKEDILSEYFEPDALMMSEEAIVIMGLLVGLNVIDCNFCVKVSPPPSPPPPPPPHFVAERLLVEQEGME